jgi:hypothetical protein
MSRRRSGEEERERREGVKITGVDERRKAQID